MDLSPHNIQRIKKWIQSEVDYNFLNPGYTIGFQDDQVLLEQNDKELKQVCPQCLLVLRYPLFFKCGHLTFLLCLKEYRRHIVIFEKLFPCPICKQSCGLNEIYTYQVKKTKRPNSISMRMFKSVKFILSYAGCGRFYPLETINHHEMFECSHRSILCPAQGCRFINNLETVIIHSINCPFHLLYCALYISLYNVSVLTHDCNVIKSQRSIPSYFKYYQENPPPNHWHKDVFLRTNSYIETFEDRGKINYDMFLSEALSRPLPTSVLTRRILQRQNGVENFSTLNTNTNKCHFHSYSLVIFTN